MSTAKNAGRHHRLGAVGPAARAAARACRHRQRRRSSGAAATTCSGACARASSSKAPSRSCAKPASAARLEREGLEAPRRRDRRRRAALPHRLRGARREPHRLRPDGAHEGSHGRARRERRPARVRGRGRRARRTSTSDRPRLALSHGRRRARARLRLHRGLRRFPRRQPRKRFRPSVLTTHERVYPFGWLGVLADVPPVSPSSSTRATSAASRFAACARRRAAAATCNAMLDADLAEWSDERFWDELAARLPAELAAQLARRRRRSRRASRRCAASSRSRCATAACSSRATPRTSCRRPAPRA